MADLLDIDYDTFRKYINERKRIIKRDLIVAICALVNANSDEAADMFYYYGMKEWLPSPIDGIDSRDDILIDILDHQKSTPFSIKEINEKLTEAEYKWYSTHISHLYNSSQVRIMNGFAFLFMGNKGHARTLVTVIPVA